MYQVQSTNMDLAVDPGLTLTNLEEFLSEMEAAPAWRVRADLECDYYDSNQHTPDEVATAELRGLPTVTINLIAPTINLVLGMEAKTRTDWTVKADGIDTPEEFAQALEVKLQEAERVTRADSATADAYGSQIKAGLGWVYVGKNMDPFGYPYKVEDVDRREVWWDMRATKRDLSDARFLVRRKWHDCDYLKALFPETIRGENIHQMIDYAADATATWDQSQFLRAMPMVQDNLVARDWFDSGQSAWRNTARQQAMLYECWYRHWVRGYVMRTPDGRIVEYNERNALHVATVGAGIAVPYSSVFAKVRLSWWLGPFRIYDVPSPFTHRSFPYIPFFGYQEDRTKAPYGMIRSMVSLQDEVNARRAKMLWQLSANRVIAEEDAVDDHDLTRQEINRPDAYVILKANRMNKGSIKNSIDIQEHEGLNAQQFQVYVDSKQTLQESAGVFNAMLGKEGAADAGVAIDLLIQQGTTTLAKINDNYRFARTLVGEQLLSLIVADLAGQQHDVVVPAVAGKSARRVSLNKPTQMEGTTLTYLSNDTERLRARVALAEIPSNPTYKQRVFQELAAMVRTLPPQLQAVVIDLVVEASDLPQKHLFAERLRKAVGLVGQGDPQSMSPDERAEAQRAAADADLRAKVQQLAERLQLSEQAAKVKDLEAGATLKTAQAAKAFTEAGQVEGTIIADLQSGAITGTAEVELEQAPEPNPGVQPGGQERDSVSFQSEGRS